MKLLLSSRRMWTEVHWHAQTCQHTSPGLSSFNADNAFQALHAALACLQTTDYILGPS